MKTGTISTILILILVLSGCAGKKTPEMGSAAGMDGAANAINAGTPQQNPSGSLWQDGQGSMFTGNTAGQVGDILTVAIYEKSSAEKEAATSTGRSSSASLGIPSLLGYGTALAAKNPNLDPSSLIGGSHENDFKGSGSTSREERLSATLTTRVVEIDRVGNLRILGSKTVRVNNEEQIIRLSGIVRPADIASNNIVDSKYILDAKIEYLGNGVISEKQRPGWLVRLLDVLSPI